MNGSRTHAGERGRQLRASVPARGRGVRWPIGLVAATVVMAAAAGCTPVASDPVPDLTSPSPEPAESASPADLAAAEAVAAAFAAHDVGTANQYIAPDRELWDGWIRHWERDAAWGVEVLMEPCVVVPPTSWATEFSCPFDMNANWSREVGSGPFTDNALTVRVADGKVLSAHREIPYDTNGFGEHLGAVWTWLEATHPDDLAFLGSDELAVNEDQWPGWLELWTQRIAEYVEANTAR